MSGMCGERERYSTKKQIGGPKNKIIFDNIAGSSPELSLSCVLASRETTTLSLTVTLLINTPASAGDIIAPASPVILYLTCCYCQTPSPLRETARQRERETWGEEEGLLCMSLCVCVCMCVCSEVEGWVGVACVLSGTR